MILQTMLRSPSLGIIERAGWTLGWSSTGAYTLEEQKRALNRLASELSTPKARTGDGIFNRIYKHTFVLALPEGANRRAVPLEEAVEYWKLLFGKSGVEWKGKGPGKKGVETPWLEWYIEFLEAKWKKSINRDLWGQTLIFAEKCMGDETLGFWREEDAWPAAIDEFVRFVGGKREGSGVKVGVSGGREGTSAEDAMEVD